MTYEYWDQHCGLIGFQPPKKTRYIFACPGSASPAPPLPPPPSRKADVGGGYKSLPTVIETNKRAVSNANSTIFEPIELVPCLTKSEGSCLKRKIPDQPESSPSNNPKTARSVGNTGLNKHDNAHDQRKTSVMQENKEIRMRCLEYEKSEEELNIKVLQLITELGEVQKEYASLLSEWLRLVKVKGGNYGDIYLCK